MIDDQITIERVGAFCPTTFKARHNTRPDAEVAKKLLRSKDTLVVYRCTDCSGWHVGHEQRKRKRIKVRR